MDLTLDKIKRLYSFQVTNLLEGSKVVTEGKCSEWARRKELKNDKDLIYVQLHIVYNGADNKSVLYTQFDLEDSEGYFNGAMPAEDYLDCNLSSDQKVKGGLLFSLYRDITPLRLWFDTKISYQNSMDPILIDIALPLASSETRTQFLEKDIIERDYMHMRSSDSGITSSRKTESLIKNVSDQCGIPYKKVINGYLFRVLLKEGRKQNVILNFCGKDEHGNELVTIGTICAPASNQKNDRIFLKLNSKMTCGAVGVSQIHDQEYYVITETLPLAVLDKELTSNIINYIAAKGDWLEDKLTGGQDIQ